MFRWLSRLLVLGIVLAALYIILSPGIFKNVQANLSAQVNTSATVVGQLETPVVAVSTPAQAAINPTVVTNATATSSSTNTPTRTRVTTTDSSSSSSALTYSNGNSTVLKKLMSQFPDTGVAPPQGSSYDNYTFPRKY